MTNRKSMSIRPGLFLPFLIVLALSLLLAGCGSTPEPAPTDTQAPLPATQPAQATAEESEPMQSPLPTPQVELPWDTEPADGQAVVRGRIEVVQEGVLLGELFLAKAVPTTNPELDLLELDQDNSPRALVDRSTGRFIFVDVEPGKYGLVAWEPMSSGPINDPETEQTLFFEVPAGEVKDLGTLYFP